MAYPTLVQGCLLILLIGGFLPASVIALRGDPGDRLIGLQLATSVAVAALILFSQVSGGQSYELTVPLVLVLLSYAGTLVFTRLLGQSRDSGGAG